MAVRRSQSSHYYNIAVQSQRTRSGNHILCNSFSYESNNNFRWLWEQHFRHIHQQITSHEIWLKFNDSEALKTIMKTYLRRRENAKDNSFASWPEVIKFMANRGSVLKKSFTCDKSSTCLFSVGQQSYFFKVLRRTLWETKPFRLSLRWRKMWSISISPTTDVSQIE